MLVRVPFEILKRRIDEFSDIGAIGRFASTDTDWPDTGQQRKQAKPSGGPRRAGLAPEFGPNIAHHCHFSAIYSRAVFSIMDTTGQVAQLVEHRTENPGVGGSIPPLSIVRVQRSDSPVHDHIFKTLVREGVERVMACWASGLVAAR